MLILNWNLLQNRHYFFGFPHEADAGKYFRDHERMILSRHGRRRIFRENLMISIFISKPGSALDAEVRRYAAENHSCYSSPSEFQIEFRAVKSAPLVFGNHEIALPSVQSRERYPPNLAVGLASHRFASATGRNVSFPSGEGLTRTKNTGISFFLKASAIAAAFFIDNIGCIRSNLSAPDAFLEVDDDQRRF